MRAAISLLSLLLAMGSVQGLAAAPPSGNPAGQGSLQFRRVYFPEGLKIWPKDGAKYLPVEAREFERLLDAAQRSSTGGPAQSAVGLAQAEYEARLVGSTILEGNATIDISPSIAAATLLTMDPCNLAVSRAQWATSDGAPVAFGTTDDGKLRALAEHSGQMKFDWSLVGRRDSSGRVVFSVDLPPCPVNRLRIDVPADLTLTADAGVLIQAGGGEAGLRRWQLELGGRSGFRLWLARKGSAAPSPVAVMTREIATYDLSLHGVELTQQLDVEGHHEPLPVMHLDLENPLQLAEAAAGDVPLRWRVEDRPGGKARRVTLELPSPLDRGPARLRFRAVAPLSAQDSWVLPRILVQGGLRRTGVTRLVVQSPLTVADMNLQGCRLTAVAASKATAGEQLEFESVGTDSRIAVSLGRRNAEVEAVTATTTVLGQGKMTSRVAADFRTFLAPQFLLTADLLPNWSIDSVELQPADSLDDWTVENRGKMRKLQVRLARPLTAERPLRIIISARRLYASPGRNLGIDDLVPLRFADLAKSRRWLDLRASGQNELRLAAGDRLQRADAKDLPVADAGLFAEPPGDLLFLDDPGAGDLRVSSEDRRPNYSAKIRVEAEISGEVLNEEYSLLCTPARSAPIDHIVVQFSGRRDAPLAWSAPGMSADRFSARRRDGLMESGGPSPDGQETWDIGFRKPQSGPIELRASRKTAIAGPVAVRLASLPEATRQEGTLVVRNQGPQFVQLKTARLDILSADSAPAGRVQTIRGSYKYDPRSEAAPQAEPALLLTICGREFAAAWVSNCTIVSRFAADGTGAHEANYRIENSGMRQVRLVLPAPLDRSHVQGVWVNGRPAVAFSASGPCSSDLTVDIPGDIQSVDLVLRIATRGRPLTTFGLLRAPLPDIGLPVFAGRWRVELPPGYCPCSESGQGVSADGPGIRRRLLGCLGRSEGEPPFSPFRGDHWRGLLAWPRADVPASRAVQGAEVVGWPACQVDLGGTDPVLMVIYRPTIESCGWLAFLLVFGAGTWKLLRRPAIFLILVAVLGVPALLLPPAFAVVFSHGLLGAMACLLLGLLRRLPLPKLHPAPAETESTLTGIVPFGAPVFAVLLLGGISVGNAAEPAGRTSGIHSALIPVDDRQRPTGGKYYLPEPFFAELHRRASLRAEKPHGWMIASATYTAAMNDTAMPTGHEIDHLTAEFDIFIFNAGARVRIPLRRDEVSLVPGLARLDNRIVQPDWDADGSALLLEIDEPGEYRLELTLRPATRPNGRSEGLDLAIPRVPTSRLELSVPTGGPQVEFPLSRGAAHWDEMQSSWNVDLGSCDRLVARWPGMAAGDTTVDVEQLLWLRIEPGCVLLDVRLKAGNAENPPRRLTIRTDSKLELLPEGSAEVSILRHPTAEEPTRLAEVKFPRGSRSAATADLHFLCAEMSSIGAFSAPRIEVLGARVIRRWLAVSIDPALEYQVPGGRLRETGAVAEFIAGWGTAEPIPDLAFRLNGNTTGWNLVTFATRLDVTADQKTDWSVGEEEVDLRWDAQLKAASGKVFQYRLDAPAALRIENIVLEADGAHRELRWSRHREGLVSVFLASPVTGSHRFQVFGRMTLPNRNRFALPQLRLEDVRIENSVMRVYRRPAVSVKVVPAAGITEVKPSAAEIRDDELGILAQSFNLDANAPPSLTVTARPNHPVVKAGQTTRMAWEEGRWHTVCDFDLHVSDGQLDSIELDIPAAWKGTAKSIPAMAASYGAIGEERGRLVLSPTAAITGRYAFVLVGPAIGSGDVSPAQVALKQVDAGRKQVVLPQSADGRPIAWTVQNLRPKPMPQPAPADVMTYEVAGEPWHALLEASRKTAGSPRIVQADVRLAWQNDGRCLGAVAFDMEAAGPIECPLSLPDGFTLVQLSVDGLPVDAVHSPAGTWNVPLASTAARCRVEALFFAADAGPRGLRALAPPRLGDWPIERVRWTIASPRETRPMLAHGTGELVPWTPPADVKLAGVLADWQRFAELSEDVAFQVSDSQADPLVVQFRSEGSWLRKLGSVAGFLVVVGLLAIPLVGRTLGNWLAPRPFLLAALLGFAWWLWGSPSVAGLVLLLIVLCCKVLSWRRARRLAPAAERT